MKNNKGFTLIELLVVVLIIGILAAIALPQYFKAVRKARAAEALIQVKALRDAADRALLSGIAAADIQMSTLDVTPNASNMYNYTVVNGVITATPNNDNNLGGVTISYAAPAAGDDGYASRPTCTNGDKSQGVCQSLGSSVTVGS